MERQSSLQDLSSPFLGQRRNSRVSSDVSVRSESHDLRLPVKSEVLSFCSCLKSLAERFIGAPGRCFNTIRHMFHLPMRLSHLIRRSDYKARCPEPRKILAKDLIKRRHDTLLEFPAFCIVRTIAPVRFSMFNIMGDKLCSPCYSCWA